MEHAPIFSASVLDRRFACPGSAVLSADAPRTSSVYADWGTDTHTLSERCLAYSKQPSDFAGMQMPLGNVVDDEMIDCAKVYVDYVRDVTGPDGTMLIEQRVEFGNYLSLPLEHQAFGTADALIVRGSEVIVVDLKTGRGVDVDPDCSQLKAYGLGCLDIAEMIADIDRVRLVIVQPRSGGIKEFDLSANELRTWARDHAAPAAQRVLMALYTYPDATEGASDWHAKNLNPGEKQCQFCPAKATCPSLRDAVLETAIGSAPASVDEFDALMDTRQVNADSLQDSDEAWLAACLSKVDLIEAWCAAVRGEVHRRLSEGAQVPGFKLVAGKKGNRAWSKADDVEKYLRDTVRLPAEKAYDWKLISPATAEKLSKAGDIGPRQWALLKDMITQSEGKPSVAPASDSRPALEVKPVADDFDLVA
jgi:hypothetical protein